MCRGTLLFVFTGLIGIWPVTKQEIAKRNSRYRLAGSTVTSPATLNAADFQTLIADHVLPAVKARYPGASHGRRLLLQMDNAPPHQKVHEAPLVTTAISQLELNLEVQFQPPNSPDLNVLDLAVFNSMQAAQYKTACRHELVTLLPSVVDCYWNFSPLTLVFAFETLKQVAELVVQNGGGNEFKIPHCQKQKALHSGTWINEVKPVAVAAVLTAADLEASSYRISFLGEFYAPRLFLHLH